MKFSTESNQHAFIETVGYSLLILIIFLIGQSVFDIADFSNKANFTAISVMSGCAAGTISLLIINRFQRHIIKSQIRLHTNKSWAYLLLLTLSGLFSIAVFYLFQISELENRSTLMEFFSSGQATWLLILSVIMIAPLFEELLFRGFMYQGLKSTTNNTLIAIFIPNSVWCLMHMAQYNSIGLLVIFSVGMFFGYARWKFDNLTVPILMHMTFNATTILFAYTL
ncbi:MAG: CPBP family intramembrane metalloprotease [Gammaproteobacteria bacterium]|nr:CPBP family intramembrane metalloprotease [Gammaproteobacteria bacterium]